MNNIDKYDISIVSVDVTEFVLHKGDKVASVLVLTNSRDGRNTESVLSKLVDRGADVIRMDVDRITTGKHQLTVDYSQGFGLVYDTPDRIADLLACNSVWLRRPYEFDFAISDPVQRAAAEEETRDVLNGVWSLLGNKYWVSDPSAITKARLKMVQLALAKQCGLLVADSIVTNDPARAKAFCEAGPTVFKPLAATVFEYDDAAPAVFTTLVTPEHVRHFDLVAKQAVLLQRYVKKAYELRVTYANETFYAAKLTTDDYGEIVDWRLPEYAERVRYTPHILPYDIDEKVRTFVRALNLRYAAIDFAVDDEGRFTFLEINPNGQWLWIEEETGLPISAAIATSLLRR